MLFSMAYEVTAARKRPQRFEELVGQDFVTATLKNSIKSGQTAHAYLFSGPRGCGKTSAARILAKVLNCQASSGEKPCGLCSACTEIAKGTCMDVIEIDGASNTSVNDVRQIKDEVLFPPNSLKYKIYIIDEVHMLSTSAFNALLKTIEEPPPYVIFIFATTELHKVPATIKSRCQQFHFRLGSMEQIKTLLAQAAAEAGITADDEALYWIARESTGSFRDAYTLFDQVAAFSGGSITYEKIRDKLGIAGIEQLNDLCRLCAAQNTKEALLFADTLLQSGVSVEQCISNMVDYLRSLLFIKSGITKEALLGQAPERYAREVKEAWSESQLERALSLFLQLYRDVRYSLNPRYELELAIEKLCALSSRISNEDVKKAVDRAARLLTGADFEPASSSAASGSVSAPAAANPSERASIPSSENKISFGRFPQKAAASEQSVPAQANAAAQPAAVSQAAELAQEPAAISQSAVPSQSAASAQSAAPAQAAAPSQSAAQVKAQSVEDLKDKTVAALGKHKAAVSAALSRTQAWSLSGSTLHIPVQTAFEQNQLQSELALLSQTVSGLWPEKLQCSVELVLPQEQQPEHEEIPDHVRMVRDAFQGEIEKIEVKQPDTQSAALQGDNGEDESL